MPKTIEINHATIDNWNVLQEYHTGTPRITHHVTNSVINSHATSLNPDIHSFYTKRFRIVMQRHNNFDDRKDNNFIPFWRRFHCWDLEPKISAFFFFRKIKISYKIIKLFLWNLMK